MNAKKTATPTCLISRLVASAALFVVGLGAPSHATGTTLLRMNLEQITQAADTIVRGRCASTSSRWDGGAIWTFAAVDVVEVLKGAPPARIEVRQPGGRVGHLSTKVEDAPNLQPAEEKILFLERNRAGDYSVTGWVQGAFRIGKSPNGEEMVTQDSSDVMVFDPGSRQFHAQGIRNLPMSDFRQRLAVALAQTRSGAR